MSAQERLKGLYEALTALSKQAAEALGRGESPESLAALFAQKAALTSQLSQIPPQEAMEPAEGRSALLEAQRNAALAEAGLVKTLQPFVSSIGNKTKLAGQNPPPRPGQRWDQVG